MAERSVPGGVPPAFPAPPRPEIPPAPRARWTIGDGAMAGLALVAVAGSWWAAPVPLAVGLGVGLVGVVSRRTSLVGLGLLLLTAGLAARSLDGLRPPRPTTYSGVVALVADPVDEPYGVRVDVRAGHHRYELDATGPAVGPVGQALAGERLRVRGVVEAPSSPAPWLVPRHVVGRMAVDEAELVSRGSWPWRAANRVRRLIDRGLVGMPADDAALFRGFVLGDDRGQSAGVVDDFRATGLTHLLVVSGENVAFVLVVVAPFSRRLRLGWRWAVTVGVVAAFALLTRFEPSVLRASAMATLAVTATFWGRRAPPRRVLALAVIVLLLIDPLLVRSLGFQLSVAASAGIVLLAPPIASWLPGPRPLADLVGVTLAAQAGIAPIEIPRFGGLPVVSVAANPLAVPVAGLVTSWGLVAGIVAGILGGRAPVVLHAPTRIMVAWVAGVARTGARLPLGQVGWWGVTLIAAGLAAIGPLRRRIGRSGVVVGVALLVVGLGAPGWALRRAPPLRAQPLAGVVLWRAGGGTVVDLQRRVSGADVLQGLRLAGVRRVDVVVERARPAPGDDPIDAIRHRWPIGTVLEAITPPRSPADQPASSAAPEQLRVGALLVERSATGVVTITPATPTASW